MFMKEKIHFLMINAVKDIDRDMSSKTMFRELMKRINHSHVVYVHSVLQINMNYTNMVMFIPI